jgi:transcription elongation factor GreA
MEKTPMTREGFNKMNEEYQRMRSEDLKECLQNLSDARDKGDLSENAEYEVAKQALNDLNNRMSKISTLLANAQIVEGAIDDGTVQMLTYVKFKNLKTNSEIEYRIVPEHEISLKEGKISPLSPIGKALLGKKAGDFVSVEIPAGKLELEILNVRCR